MSIMEGATPGPQRVFLTVGLGAAVLVAVLFGTSSPGKITSGIPAGFGMALATWLSFALSLSALGYLVFRMAARRVEVSLSKKGLTSARLGAMVLAGVAAVLLFLQFGTGVLGGIESGIRDGEAPVALADFSSVIWLLTLGVGIVSWKGAPAAVPNIAGPVTNGGEKLPSQDVVVEERTLVLPQEEPAAETEESPVSVKYVVGAPTITIDDIKRVGMIMAQKDVEALTAHGSPGIGEADRDFLQIKKNVSEWILLSLSIGGKMPKQKLESSFEDQFPKRLLPLFNSVLYDLIYQSKVESSRDGTKMMITLPKS